MAELLCLLFFPPYFLVFLLFFFLKKKGHPCTRTPRYTLTYPLLSGLISGTRGLQRLNSESPGPGQARKKVENSSYCILFFFFPSPPNKNGPRGATSRQGVPHQSFASWGHPHELLWGAAVTPPPECGWAPRKGARGTRVPVGMEPVGTRTDSGCPSPMPEERDVRRAGGTRNPGTGSSLGAHRHPTGTNRDPPSAAASVAASQESPGTMLTQ